MNPAFLDLPLLLMSTVVVSLRVFVSFSMLPMFISSSVPTTVRAGLAMAVALPVVAAQMDAPPLPDLQGWTLILLVAREAGIGLVIGLGFGAFCAGLQTAGDIIDHQTGLTFTQNVDATFGNNVSITAQFFDRVLFGALMSAGFVLIVVDALYLSYEIWPVGMPLPTFERLVPLSLVEQSSRLFAFALLMAGPVLLVLFTIDAGLGMLNRAAPQLGIFQITLSLKAVVGLIVLMFALPLMIEKTLIALTYVAQTIRALILAGG
jgi:type III secretion protein T